MMALFEADSIFPTSPFAPAATPVAPKPVQPSTVVASTAPVAPAAAPVIPAVPAPQPAVAPKLIQPADTSLENVIERTMAPARMHESGGSDTIVNKVGAEGNHATGRYQFLPSTWAGLIRTHPELGLTPQDIYNGEKQDIAYRAFLTDNAHVLQGHGIEVNPANLFMLSFMGPGAGPAFIKQMQQTPGAIAASVFPNESKYNLGVFYHTDAQGHPLMDQPRTLAQVYGVMTKSFGGQAPAGGAPAETAQAAYQVAQGPSTVMSDAAVDVSSGVAGDAGLPPAVAAAQQKLTLITPINVPLPNAPPLPGHPSLPVSPTATPADGLPDAVRKAQETITGAPAPVAASAGTMPENPFKPDPETKLEPTDVVDFGPDFGSQTRNLAEDEKARAGMAEFAKGAGAGAARSVLGPLSLLPPLPGDHNGGVGTWAERQNDALAGVGSRGGQITSQAAGMLVPYGSVVKGAAKAPEILSDAISGAKSIWPTIVKGMGRGGITGAQAGSTTATGEEQDYGKRIAKKAPEMAKEGATFAAIGGAIPAAAPLAIGGAKWIGRQLAALPGDIKNAIGTKAREAAEALYRGVNAETGKALTAQEAKEAAATLQESVQRAEQAAAETTATKVAEDFAKRPTMPPEEFGRQLQTTAEADAKALKDARSTLSGFDAAASADGGRPSVPTKQFISAVTEAEKRAVSPEMKSTLTMLKNELRTQGDANSPTVTAVSIQRARRIIQTLDGRIDGIPGDERAETIKLKDAFVEHLESVHPNMKTARQRYAELSRPLDIYRDSGALAKATLEDPYSGKNILDTTKVVGSLLNKSEAGADALGRMIQANPKLQDSARQFFNQRLADAAAARGAPSYGDYARLLRDQRLALDRAGLTDEFKALAKQQQAAEKGVEAARGETQRNIDELVKTRAEAAAKAEKIRDFQREIAGMDEKLLKDVPAKADSIAGQMKTAGVIDGETYARMLKDIQDVKVMYKDEAEARKKIRNILIVAAGAAGVPFIRHTLPLSVGGH